MQHGGKRDNFPFWGLLFIREKISRKQFLQNNTKIGSRPKYNNKNTDTSSISPPRATISCHWPKVNSVCFEDPYDHINDMNNTHDYTHILDTHVEQKIEDSEENLWNEETNENTINEEELDNIHPDVDNNFPSPTMNSGLMTVHNIYPEKYSCSSMKFSG